jgi:hypothetical protein
VFSVDEEVKVGSRVRCRGRDQHIKHKIAFAFDACNDRLLCVKTKREPHTATLKQPTYNMTETSINKPALVFGASGEQGRAVLEGFVDAGYSPVYAFSSNPDTISDQYLSDALQCILLDGKISNPDDVAKALRSTKAQAIFLVTATEMPAGDNAMGGFQAAEDEEYDTIIQWFKTLQQVYQEDKLPRTVVFSTRDNVQALAKKKLEENGKVWIEPLDDGSVVPHYSAKGKGGEEAAKMLQSTPDLKLIQLTMPFFYSNFLAFFCPLPNDGKTQWQLLGCFGPGNNKIDMMSVSDVGPLVGT